MHATATFLMESKEGRKEKKKRDEDRDNEWNYEGLIYAGYKYT